MSGQRFSDLATLLRAAADVATKHVESRSRNLKIYHQTSSVATRIRESGSGSTAAGFVRNTDDNEQALTSASISTIGNTVKTSSSTASRDHDSAPPRQPAGHLGRDLSQRFQGPHSSRNKSPTEVLGISAAVETKRQPVQHVDACAECGEDAADPDKAFAVPNSPQQGKIYDLKDGRHGPKTQRVRNERANPGSAQVESIEPMKNQELSRSRVSEEMFSKLFHNPRIALSILGDFDRPTKKPHSPVDSPPQTNYDNATAKLELKSPSVHGSKDIFPDSTGIASNRAVQREEAVQLPANDSPLQMRESKVPSSRLGRMWQYGSLATTMAFGTLGEGIRRVARPADEHSGSLVMSEANINRLVAKLSRMRGAALKLGQMLSFQGTCQSFRLPCILTDTWVA